MWLGAHPGDPSHLVGRDGRRTSLLDAVRADPEGLLGADRSAKWSGNLPYLLKVLAADEPLSLQAHPSAAQAAEGFARENAAGIPVDAPTRNYRDASHKPELICALTEFHALVGFREIAADPRAAARAGRRRAGPARRAAGGAAGRRGPARPVHHVDHASAVGARPRGARAADGAACGSPRQGGEFAREARMALELSERYPGDAGVLAALLLNLVVLAPGEALYLPAGNLHAYLSGAGVELMANSDNVLRGGLTSKHVDVAELLRVLDFTPRTPPVLHGVGRRRLGALRHGRRGVPAAAPRGRPGGAAGRRARRWPADPAVHARLGAGARGGRQPIARARTTRRGGSGSRPTTVTSPSPRRRPAPSCSSPVTGWTSEVPVQLGPIRPIGAVRPRRMPASGYGTHGGTGARKRRRAACRRAAERRRSSRRCWRTPASRWRSSSATWSRGRRRCSPRRCTRWPTPATRACCCSAASGRSARRRPSTRSATAATGTSTPSSSRCCCSASARCSRSTRASTSSRATSRSPRRWSR